MKMLTQMGIGEYKNWHQDRAFLNDSTAVRRDLHNRSVWHEDRILNVVVERKRS